MISVLLKNKRNILGFKIQEISAISGIDQALLSKYESGKRNPSDNHLLALSNAYQIPYAEIKKEYLIAKIVELVKYEVNIGELFLVAETRVEYLTSKNVFEIPEIDEAIKSKLKKIDSLKTKWQENRPLNKTQIAKMKEYFSLKYTFDSNRIEGNTLSLKETHLVVNEGVTISGKSMKEHLEAINHSEAVGFLENLISEKEPINKRSLLDLHRLVLKSVDSENAGKYRNLPVRIGGSEYLPPQPFLLEKLMEDYFFNYNRQRKILHPVLLAAEMHERLVSIHPFLDGNGRTSRLIMNFILLQNGFTLAILKGDSTSRVQYFDALQDVQLNNNPIPFYHLVIDRCIESLQEHLSMV